MTDSSSIELGLFAAEGLFELLMAAVCGDCRVPDHGGDACVGCPGDEMLREMERQISSAGIEVMQQMVGELQGEV